MLFLTLVLTLAGCGSGEATPTPTPCPDDIEVPNSSSGVYETLTIHPIIAEGSTADAGKIGTQEIYANRVLKETGIQIKVEQAKYLNDMGESNAELSVSQNVLGSNLLLDAKPERSPDPSLEEAALTSYYNNSGGRDITAYYVLDIFIEGFGSAYGKHYKSSYTNTNSIAISDNADDRTLVHEIGHVLGLRHPNDDTGWPHGTDGAPPQSHGIYGDENQSIRQLIERNFMTQSEYANRQDDYISDLQTQIMYQNIPLD